MRIGGSVGLIDTAKSDSSTRNIANTAIVMYWKTTKINGQPTNKTWVLDNCRSRPGTFSASETFNSIAIELQSRFRESFRTSRQSLTSASETGNMMTRLEIAAIKTLFYNVNVLLNSLCDCGPELEERFRLENTSGKDRCITPNNTSDSP